MTEEGGEEPHQAPVSGELRCGLGSHYGSSDNMALSCERDVNLVAPARPPKGTVSGRLTLTDFTLNKEGLVLRDPITSKQFGLTRQSQAAAPFRPLHLPKMPRYTAVSRASGKV